MKPRAETSISDTRTRTKNTNKTKRTSYVLGPGKILLPENRRAFPDDGDTEDYQDKSSRIDM